MTGIGAAGGAMSMAACPVRWAWTGQHAPMGGYGPAGAAHGGGLFGSMGMGGDLFSSSELELNRESRGGMLSLWSHSSRSPVQRHGGRAVAQRRRADHDGRGRLLARRR